MASVETDSSSDEIDVGADFLAYFKAEMAVSKSSFVIESKAAPTAAPHWNRYRCDGHFKNFIDWLRSKGVTVRKSNSHPAQRIRKFGQSEIWNIRSIRRVAAFQHQHHSRGIRGQKRSASR